MMCCFYPTTTVAIDDDTDFLETLTQHLDKKFCIAYFSPKTAIESLKDQNSHNRIHSRIVKNSCITSADINSCPDNYAIISNMRGLHEEIYNEKRFEDVSVIIVDYYMDELNGVNVCRAL